jgi:hypothetical protein
MFRQNLNKILKLSSFSNFVLQKFKFSKMIALPAFVNTVYEQIANILKFIWKKVCYFDTLFFKQSEIRPVCNIACSAGTFLSLPILGGWWLDLLPARRHFKLIAAIQCTF